ncbi:ABC-2 type transport system permease protein [Actinoplanes lutulentus]|uniref:ABC-2 type transport system permease protein n=1 Tax=Actinoplanes lutulentus TaxID=1287878 RepID=A0A327Z6S4_9ACTN|nr:ABC transporter permease [Actinoplanes lutulentus]MBB2942253.1 ABC-2 type transport system permease protein [Actinoplanes lutulentus]RAK33022.1 ABC-2 type transport system permease protein [Actinoplanes lutulentus]
MTTFEATRLVAARELRTKLRDKAFLYSTAFFLVIVIASIVLPAILGGGPTKVATAVPAATAPLRQAGFEVVEVTDVTAAERLLRDGEVEAAVVPGPEVLAMEEPPSEVVAALSVAPPVRLLEAGDLDPFLKFLIPSILAMLFFITSYTYGLQIAQSVIEEKQTRIVEILVSSVSVRALLAGKVAAMTLLAFGQIALLALVAFVGMKVTDVDTGVVNAVGPALGWFLPFFVLGFLMLATVWAGVGALASRQEEITSTSSPVQMAVLIPFFAVLFLQDNAEAQRILSYIPFSSPIAMPIRTFNGDAAAWEPLVSLLILAVTAVLLLAAGARIYQGSLMRTRQKTSLLAAWKNA